MKDKITVTNLNIRQSIAILLAKLVLIDIVAALLVIGAYLVLVQGGTVTEFAAKNILVFLIAFGLGGIAKIAAGVYVVLQWLNEYYEITPENIVHKSGIIFKKTEMYELNKIRVLDVQDSFLGEIFNYATMTLYDIRLNKYLVMYLVHNPQRYAKVLKTLRPHLEIKKDRVSLPFMPTDELLGETID